MSRAGPSDRAGIERRQSSRREETVREAYDIASTFLRALRR